MKEMEHFRLSLPTTLPSKGSFFARVLPFGEGITKGDRQVGFQRGAITAAGPIPLTVDHGTGVEDRIGVITKVDERDDGLYAEVDFADTQKAQDVRELLRVGAVADVSAGIKISGEEFSDEGFTSLTGELDHISVVVEGAFGGADSPSKVLQVHSTKGETVSDVKAPDVEQEDAELTKLAGEVESLRGQLVELSVPEGAVITAQRELMFKDKKDFILTLAAAAKGDIDAGKRMEEFALADDTTTTAVGVVPDFQSQEVISIIDTSRPYLQTIPQDPIGDHGMTINYPTVATKPTVNVQATEKLEVSSTAMSIVVTTADLLTYAGASDVSRQLIERSDPSFVDILFREYASAYAQDTDKDAGAAAFAGVGDTAILADLGADAAATFAAVGVANAAVIAGVRAPITHWAMGATRWAELNSLVDTDGRPLLVFPANGPTNAQGQSSFTTMVAQYHGIVAFLDPNLAATATFLYNRDLSNAFVEQSPVQLRAEVVSLLGFEMGVYGLFAHVIKLADGSYSFTVA